MTQSIFSTISLAIAAIMIAGCGGASSTPTSSGDAAVSSDKQDHANHDYGDHDHGAAGSGMEKIKAELAKLSPEDAASAEQQHICPVSGEMLGSMGIPIKVDVKGESVWICCDGCKQKLLDNADEFIAKVKGEQL